jgi:MFS family permease
MIFSLVYMGFALSNSRDLMWFLFILYGLYAAATEGISKAWVSDLTGDDLRGTAIGLITMSGSLALMAGSVITGFLWDLYGSQVPFALTSITSLFTAAALYIFTDKNQ